MSTSSQDLDLAIKEVKQAHAGFLKALNALKSFNRRMEEEQQTRSLRKNLTKKR